MTDETPRERLRSITADLLGKLDASAQHGGIHPEDPMGAEMACLRAHAIAIGAFAAEIVEAVSQGAKLNPETEAKLVERVGVLAATAVRAETGNLVRGTLRRFTVAAISGAVIALLLVGGGSYWLGSRGSLITLQIRPGEIAGVCRGDAVQPAPDGQGRLCGAWIRLDQATLAGPGR